jgi:hypothetical protein
MQVKADTKCGASPGPGCLGCYAHGICGSEDGIERDISIPDEFDNMSDGGE